MIIDVVNQSKTVLAAGTAATGYPLQNTSVFPIWVDSNTAATNDGSSILLQPGEAIDSTTPGLGIAHDLNVFAPEPGGRVAVKHD